MSCADLRKLMSVLRVGYRRPRRGAPEPPGPPSPPRCRFCGRPCWYSGTCQDLKLWTWWRSWTTRFGLQRRLGEKLERMGRRLMGQNR